MASTRRHWTTPGITAPVAAAPATEHMARAPATESPAADVAVLFAGWLIVVIPDRGAQARASLVDPLGADVIVAGTPEGWFAHADLFIAPQAEEQVFEPVAERLLARHA